MTDAAHDDPDLEHPPIVVIHEWPPPCYSGVRIEQRQAAIQAAEAAVGGNIGIE